MIKYCLMHAVNCLRTPEEEPSPYPLSTAEAIKHIMERWGVGEKFAKRPRLARTVLYRIALLGCSDPELSRRALEWACNEAPRWWPEELKGKPATPEQLVSLESEPHRGRP